MTSNPCLRPSVPVIAYVSVITMTVSHVGLNRTMVPISDQAGRESGFLNLWGTEEIHTDWDKAPELIVAHLAMPEFPEFERRARWEGKAVLKLLIDEKGKVLDALVESSEPTPYFGPAAMLAVLQWEYLPAEKNGEKIRVAVSQPVEFSLSSRPEDPGVVTGRQPPGVSALNHPPLVLHIEVPRYPESARKAGVEGRVFLEVAIGIDGQVGTIQTLRADPPGIFAEAAISAVGQWEFEPAILAGEPLEVPVVLPVEFRLNEDHEPDFSILRSLLSQTPPPATGAIRE